MPDKVKMTLVGVDGNAFAVLGAFIRNAKKQNWKKHEIDEVVEESKCGDYNYLLQTILKNIDDGN